MSSIIKVDQIQDSGGNNLVTSNGSGVVTSTAFGKIGQIVSTTKTDTFTLSTGSNTFTDITGLSATITPTSTSSKIYINFIITYGNSTGSIVKARLLRGTTPISIGDASGSRQQATVGNYNGTSATAMIQVLPQKPHVKGDPTIAHSFSRNALNFLCLTQASHPARGDALPHSSYECLS